MRHSSPPRRPAVESLATCYLVGRGNLLLECAKLLREAGVVIEGIFSPSDDAREWCEKSCINWFYSMSGFDWQDNSVDYLFSIVNDEIISSDVLTSIRKLAINYHDAPLPRYAGSNATSWAIINDEKDHAITWHVISDYIDGGDVLKQHRIGIVEDETAFSLNLKCAELAITSFSELVDELLNNTYSRTQQNFEHRTYFSRGAKPINNGWIDWHNGAKEIERLYRATYFGDYCNPFAVCKILLHEEVLIVKSLSVTSELSVAAPGSIQEVNQHGWIIATKTHDVLLSSVSTATGSAIGLDTLANRYGISVGCHLMSPRGDNGKELLALSERYFPFESYWLRKLRNFEPTSTLSKCTEFDLSSLPQDIYNELTKSSDELTFLVFAACLIYLRRLEEQAYLNIFVQFDNSLAPDSVGSFFSKYLPFSISINDAWSFSDLLSHAKYEYQQIKKNQTYLKDIWQRCPELSWDESFQTGYRILLGEIKPCSEQIKCRLPTPLLTLCRNLLRNPGCPIIDIDWVTNEERKRVLLDWNATDKLYPTDKTVHGLFEEQVSKTPHNLALIYNEIRLTYAELNCYANRLAHHIKRNFSVNPGDLIVLIVERSHLALISMLAVLKAGGAYVPIDPSCPDERIRYIIEDTKSALVLTCTIYQDRFSKLIDGKTQSVLSIDADELTDHLNMNSADGVGCTVSSSDLAYVIYTSGTTGCPKGVMIEHGSVVNLVYAQAHEFGLLNSTHNCYRRCLGYSNPAFDAHVWEYYVTLANGHALFLINNTIQKDIEELCSYVKKNEIYMATIPPILLDDSCLLPLKKLIVAGEKTEKPVIDAYLSNGVEVINAYGPTESTVCATTHTYRFQDIATNIGKPIQNIQIYILDAQQKLVPELVQGEIYIGGIGVSRGYVNLSTLTDDRYTTNPFQSEDEKLQGKNSRLYKTGDIGRWLPDGTIEYVGRNDDQIKIRGHRINLSEIENMLLDYPNMDIQHAVVLLKGGKAKYLVAYYVSNHEIESDSLERYLATKLPSYMVPKSFVYISELPYTKNGKLDQAALPNSEYDCDKTELPPANQLEASICKTFAEVLDLLDEDVGIFHDFFKIGGNSLNAIRLTAKLRALLDVKVTDIFELKTPHNIAHFLPVSHGNLLEKVNYISEIYANTLPYASKDWVDDENSSLLEKYTRYIGDIEKIKFNQETKKIQCVLLTGSTGHLGCHILEQLLRETRYIIYLPVRGSSTEIAKNRLSDKFRYYFDSDLFFHQDRMVIFDADIQMPDFGINIEKYNELVSQVDSVIHCAALVKHLGHYNDFFLANIQTTRNLLEFTRLTRNQDFHHISTVSVPSWGCIPGESSYLFAEDDDISKIMQGNNFYVQTKYKAELLVREYQEYGINANIYRVGNLGMNSMNCRIQENIESNFFFSHFKSLIQLQMVPSEFSKVEWSPVDHTALAIVKLFDKVGASNQTHHIFNPYTCDLFELLNNSHGFKLKKVHISEFIREVLVRFDADDVTKTHHLLSLYQLWVNEIHGTYNTKIRLLQDKTQYLLANLGFSWSKILPRHLSSFVEKSL